MRNIDRLLDEYGEGHHGPVDRFLHWLCLPVIAWAIVALLWSIPFPWPIGRGIVPLNWAVVGVVAAQVYWFRLSRRLGSGLMLFNLALLWLTATLEAGSPLPLWQAGLATFATACAAYFLGILVERRRTSLSGHADFVLIGPIWLVSTVYRRLGLPG